jgi:hypothetical protein
MVQRGGEPFRSNFQDTAAKSGLRLRHRCTLSDKAFIWIRACRENSPGFEVYPYTRFRGEATGFADFLPDGGGCRGAVVAMLAVHNIVDNELNSYFR